MGLATRHRDRLGNGGLTFTELGVGTAPLGNLYRAVPQAEAEAALQSVIPGGQSAEMAADLRVASASVPLAPWGDLKAAGLLRADVP